MTTFVLVGGAWLGAWAWDRLVPLLRERGHDPVPMTLRGLADRAAEGGPHVNLTAHVKDVVSRLEREDLRDVVLVAHSYGGLPVTGALHEAPEPVDGVVYVSAVVPGDGGSLADLWSPAERARIEETVRGEGDGWAWPLPPSLVEASGPDLSPQDRDRLLRRATPHPWGTLTEPVRTGKPLVESVPRTYVRLTLEGEDTTAERMSGTPGWTVVKLKTGHWPMLSAPHDLAAVLTGTTG